MGSSVQILIQRSHWLYGGFSGGWGLVAPVSRSGTPCFSVTVPIVVEMAGPGLTLSPSSLMGVATWGIVGERLGAGNMPNPTWGHTAGARQWQSEAGRCSGVPAQTTGGHETASSSHQHLPGSLLRAYLSGSSQAKAEGSKPQHLWLGEAGERVASGAGLPPTYVFLVPLVCRDQSKSDTI